jgi:calcium-dependent protein kinase
MLSGRPPFEGENNAEIFLAIGKGKYSMRGKAWQGVSPQAKDLVFNLLVQDPAQRMTAVEALAHPWIQTLADGAAPSVDNGRGPVSPPGVADSLSPSTLNRLRSFAAERLLCRLALGQMARCASEAGKVSTLHAAALGQFRAIDLDGSGTIQLSELHHWIVQTRAAAGDSGAEDGPESDELAELLLRALDADGSGRVSYEEFLAAMLLRRGELKEHLLEEAFRRLDVDNSGAISPANLSEILRSGRCPWATGFGPGPKESLERAAVEAVEQADANGDGVIDYPEFLAMMRRKEPTGMI